MTTRKSAEVVVIGGGPGGYVAATRAAQLGMDVVLIERDRIGGTCLNRGCVPIIYLQRQARLFSRMKDAGRWGIRAKPSLDFGSMMKGKDEVVDDIVRAMNVTLRKEGVKLIEGEASFLEPGSIEVSKRAGDKETIEYEKAIIATGCRPDTERLEASKDNVITTDEALELREVPKSIAVIGGDSISTSLASIFMELGSQVILLVEEEHILPDEDGEIAVYLQETLKSRGLKIFTETQVEAVSSINGTRKVSLLTSPSRSEIAAEKVLLCHRTPLIGGLGLDRINVKTKQGILVNDKMETTEPGVYAVGDVLGRHALAHVALAEGMVAAENAAEEEKTMDYRIISQSVHSIPELAGVGLTEKQAKDQGYRVKVSTFPFSQNTLAKTVGETEGLIKAVADRESGEVLGVHMVGLDVSNLVAECALAIKLEATIEDIAQLIHVHPSKAEAVRDVFWKMYRALHYK
ncbi:MAG: dihydrolipoyl dehydrogenase [Nitrososphaeria archaeon]|nr:dihydrolipoyl dehydrogenase [Nitrososphaeria archaeon]NIN52439.1 dihydrolipoyl dehydrogenase [Nitrososphaeria archaeon]NIQ32940.1 dihydrolipoyl dehydrogenase [Nitrososphaeria archaeon]